MKFINYELNGKKIAFGEETEFLVQVSRYKGAYKTRYSFKGNLVQAVRHYEGINIGNGYNKRLYSPSMNKPVLLRAKSS